MELSTIIRLKVVPPVGLRPSLFPSGALVYSEPDNSLYYAGGDNGDARATYIQLVNNSSFGGTVTSIDVTSGTLAVSGAPVTKSGTVTIDLKNTGVAPGTYGSGGQVPVVSVDKYGRLTNVQLVPINIGGTVKSVTIESTTLEIVGSPVTTSGIVKVNLPATGVLAGSYGSGSKIPVITVDSYGRITSALNVSVTGAAGDISHDFTLVGSGSSTDPLGTSLRSQMVLDSSSKLLENGNIVIGPTTAYTSSANQRNICIGTNALTSLKTSVTTFDNVSVGNYSLYSSLSNTQRNVVVGVNAGKSVTQPTDNVIVGYNAISLATSITNTIAIGTNVQNDVAYSVSARNVIIGNDAKAGTTGNVIIGDSASSYAPSFTNGVGIGASCSVGDQSIAIGGNSQANAKLCTSIGYGSYSNTNSIAIGHSAAIADDPFGAADGGIAIGTGAVSNTNSIAIGAKSDSQYGFYTTVIGTNAKSTNKYCFVMGMGAVSGADYEFCLGSSAYPIGNPDGSGVEFSASSGSASALPATPAAYFRLRLNGTVYKLPLYNA